VFKGYRYKLREELTEYGKCSLTEMHLFINDIHGDDSVMRKMLGKNKRGTQ
jgi:hypothetical protein